MRDILTVIASALILVLTAAVVAPPLLDWTIHRDTLDRAISHASGMEAHTHGNIELRLLPTPRLQVDQLQLGGNGTEAPRLVADYVWLELALMPLLRNQLRFIEARIGRADVDVTTGANGDWRLPPSLLQSGNASQFAIEKLFIGQLSVTAHGETGRSDQLKAEQLSIEVQNLSGPWRVEGLWAQVPFRLVTGQIAPDKSVTAKLSGGGDNAPRFDIDANISFENGPDGTLKPALAGKGRMFLGPPAQVAAVGIPIPISIEAGFSVKGRTVELDPVTVEAGEGSASLRAVGTGNFFPDEPRLALKLDGRRFDADSFILSASGKELLRQFSGKSLPHASIAADLDLSIASIELSQEELSNARLRASLLPQGIRLDRLEFTAPGDTRVTATGLGNAQGDQSDLAQGNLAAKIFITSAASERLARYLSRFRVANAFISVLDGRPVEARSDAIWRGASFSLDNTLLKIGDATVSGFAHYILPENGANGRLDADIALRGLSLDRFPQISSFLGITKNVDVGLNIDMRELRTGGRPSSGQLTARIASDGPALRVESLEIVDMAGADAKVEGRIWPDGTGQIAGKVTAKRAAPLIDLLGSVWIGGVSKLFPTFLRDGDLDLDVRTERASLNGAGSDLSLRTHATGRAAGGDIAIDMVTSGGLAQSLDVELSASNAGLWFGHPDLSSLRHPAKAMLKGTRVASGQFSIIASGDVGGITFKTNRPFVLGAGDDLIETGEAEIASSDVTPFLPLLASATDRNVAIPVDARLTWSLEGASSLIDISGSIFAEPVQARLEWRGEDDAKGSVTLEHLSLPWLLNAAALPGALDKPTEAMWSTARFGDRPVLFDSAQIAVTARKLELGGGLAAENATFTLSSTAENLLLRDFSGQLDEGSLSGSLSISRSGSLASLSAEGSFNGIPLSFLTGPSPFEATLSGEMKIGASGESVAGLIANLGGGGDIKFANLKVANLDEKGLERAILQLLKDNDPLGSQRAEMIVSQELSKANLTAPAVLANATIIGGSIRLSPFTAQGADATWKGSVVYDLKTKSFDARGALSATNIPQGWSGSPPSVGLFWRGSLANPIRDIQRGSLGNGLAAIVLQRELDKIESFEADANERLRNRQRSDMDRQRDRQAAEDAARRAREEDQPALAPPLPPPVDIKPAPSIQVRPGG